jgi:RHS repeat-associated protein
MEIETVSESGRRARPDLVVEERRLPNGAVIRVYRDLLGRVRREERPDGTWVRFLYRLDGGMEGALASSGERIDYSETAAPSRTLAASTARSHTEIRLGEGGLPVGLRQRVDGHTWEVRYERDVQGRVVRMLAPGASEWSRPLPAAYAHASAERSRCRLSFATGVEIIERDGGARGQSDPASIELRNACGLTREVPLRFDDNHRVVGLGDQQAAYDQAGRITEFGATRLEYDETGRLRARCSPVERVEFDYDGMAVSEARSRIVTRYDYDQMGRRSCKSGPEGETRYGYNLLGLLDWVALPNGQRIEYLYDGFGRLVGRSTDGHTVYFIVGFDGERLAEADETGQVTTSYLWLGRLCVGRVAEAIGGALLQSYHWGPGARLLAVGDSDGKLDYCSADSPFGAVPTVDGVPGFGGLFGDSLTGLLHAGSRWLDPELGQFVTPDSWLDVDPGRDLPPGLRRILRRLPGGTDTLIRPEQAYTYCGYDPINQVDPTGHSGGGLALAIISALFWESQLTGLAYEMEFINILCELFLWFASIWIGKDEAWKWSVANLAPPAGSTRIGAFAWVLNGPLKFHPDRCWTLGNVIWASGSGWAQLEKDGSRDLVMCDDAGNFLGRTNQVAVDLFRVRNPETKMQGTVSPSGTEIDGVNWTVAGATEPLATCLPAGTWLCISTGDEATEEYRRVASAAPGNIKLDSPATPVGGPSPPALPATFCGHPVTIHRLDLTVVRLTAGGGTVGRTVKFVRGNALHLSWQIPAGFPSEGITVDELVPARNSKEGQVNLPASYLLLRFKDKDSRDKAKAAGFLRVQDETKRYATKAAAAKLDLDLTIDPPLPDPAAGKKYQALVVTNMTASGASAAGQDTFDTRKRVGLGNMAKTAKLNKGDGLEISNAAAAIERRIVTELRLQIPVDALPAAFEGKEVSVRRMRTLPATRSDAKMGVDGVIVPKDPKGALPFEAGQMLELRLADKYAYGTVDTQAAGDKTIKVKPIPGPDFAADTEIVACQVDTFGETWKSEAIVASRTTVVLPSPDGLDVGEDDILQIKHPTAGDPDEIRRAGDPVTLAVLDSPLPDSHPGGLTVTQFVAGDDLNNVAAPAMRPKMVPTGAGILWAVNDIVFLQAGKEEVVAEIQTTGPTESVFKEPIEMESAAATASALTLILQRTTTAKLDSAMVILPSDLTVEQTQRKAVEHHELRHSFQGAMWGPFFLSMPLPWLFHLGFSLADHGSKSSKASAIVRNIGTGGIDSLFTLPFWGIEEAAGKGGATATGTLGADLRTVTFASAPSDNLASGNRVTVKKPDRDEFNVIDSRDGATLVLRFKLPDDAFAPGDQVEISFSRFEQIRKWVSVFLGQNYQQIWSDYIPKSWGRAISQILDHDSWFPGFGIYPLALMVAKGVEIRVPLEQEAAYYSGDLYTTIVVADPYEIYVGQFARLYAFVQMRGGEGLAAKEKEAATTLQLQLPVTAADTREIIAGKVHGSLLMAGTDNVRFRTRRFLPVKEKAGNLVGVLFSSGHAGTYPLLAPGQLPPGTDIVFQGAFDVGFLKASQVTVKALEITPKPTDPIYETASVTFAIKGGGAPYVLEFPAGTSKGTINGLTYKAAVIADAAPSTTQVIRIFVDYKKKPDGVEQADWDKLPAEEKRWQCGEHTLTIQRLVAPAEPLVVKAGGKCEFLMPLPPARITPDPTKVKPPGATTTARAMNGGLNGDGKAKIVFVAPNKVKADTTIDVTLTYVDAAKQERPVKVSITVKP